MTEQTRWETTFATETLTPWEAHEGIMVKRDDRLRVPGANGGKIRTIVRLALQRPEAAGLIGSGLRTSTSLTAVAAVGRYLDLAVRLHVPAGDETPETVAAEDMGAVLVRHRPGYPGVVAARAREDAEAERDDEWVHVPMGMECLEAVRATASQVREEPVRSLSRLVVPVGSGMSLLGVLWGCRLLGLHTPLVGVVCGADPRRRLSKFSPGWEEQVTLVGASTGYHDKRPAEACYLGDLQLDSTYEAKCLDYLQAGDGLWVVGKGLT